MRNARHVAGRRVVVAVPPDRRGTRALRVRGRFELVHSAEDEEYGKPHPAVFLTAAAKLGAPARRCLVWEDAPAGVVAAKAATMACIAVPEEGQRDQPAFVLADLVVDSLLQVDGSSLDEVARRHEG